MFFLPEPVRRSAGLYLPADVPAYRQVLPQLVAELRRARRYEHCFAVVVVAPHPQPGATAALWSAAADLPPTTVTPTLYFLLGSFLRNSLRETDILTAAPEAMSYALFLAETDRAHAERAIERLRAGFRACAPVDLWAGCSDFPAAGLTIEDLVESAWNECRQAFTEDAADAPARGPTAPLMAHQPARRAAPGASHG